MTLWYNTEHYKVQRWPVAYGTATTANNESELFTKKQNRTLITQMITVISRGLQIWPNVVSTKVGQISWSDYHTASFVSTAASFFQNWNISLKVNTCGANVLNHNAMHATMPCMPQCRACFLMPVKHSTPWYLHVDSPSSDVRQFADILESFDLDQRVDFPTHIHGHSLDLMIFSKGFNVLSVSVSDKISDHFSVVGDLNIPRINSRTVLKTIRYRNLKAINVEADHELWSD